MVLIVQSVLVNGNIHFFARKSFHVRYLMDILNRMPDITDTWEFTITVIYAVAPWIISLKFEEMLHYFSNMWRYRRKQYYHYRLNYAVYISSSRTTENEPCSTIMIAFSSLLCDRRGYLHFIHHDELRVSLRKFLHLLEMTLGLY